MILRVFAGGGGYPQGAHAGKTNRPGGRAPTGNAARQADERGRVPGSAGETLATQGRRPSPHNPQDTARQENPCRSPALRAMSLSGCLRQAYAGRSVVVRAADNGVFGRLGTARWRRLQGQQEKPLKTAGCSILPPLPPHPLTKIVTPTGTLPTNCQRLAGGHGGGRGPIRTGEQKNALQNNRLKKILRTGTQAA